MPSRSDYRDRDTQMLETIRSLQARYLDDTPVVRVFEQLLQALLDLTESGFGFIGEVLVDARGERFMRMQVATNISWNQATARYFENSVPEGLDFHDLDNLFGWVIQRGLPLVTNEPASDSRSRGLPPGHPPLRSFAGIPLIHGSQVIGMVGLANREDGYDDELVAWLEPILTTCSSLVRNVRANRERLETMRQLEEARAAADAASRAKGEFLAHMSHELRTPLTAILGAAELLNSGDLDGEERSDWLRTLERSADHLLGLVEGVLDLASIEAGHVEPRLEPASLRGVVETALGALVPLATQKGLLLDWRVAEDVPDAVVTDPTRLRQILVNLSGNSLKFTDRGSVEVRVVRRASGGDRDRDLLEIAVHDTGAGIPADKIDSIFERFERIRREGHENTQGTGLGLAITLHLIQMLDGEIQVESLEGEGSVFRVTLPLVGAETDAPRPIAAAAAEPLSAPPERDGPWRIVLAEDGPDTQKLVVRVLERAGFEIRAFGNGRDAVDHVLAHPTDLVLMDLQMPILDGYRAVAELRGRGIRIPVVALTAAALDEERQRALEAGFTAFATKPIRSRSLVETVCAALHEARPTAQTALPC